MNCDCVIFDFDGTVAETSRGILNCIRYALERMDLPVPGEDVLHQFIGPPLFTSFRDFCHLSDEDAERAVSLFRERYTAKGMFEAEIYPGLTPLVKALKERGCWVAVASGKVESSLKAIIDHFGLTKDFDAVTGSRPNSHSSDKRDQILAALPEGADLSRACMVGDRCFDIDAGRALGMRTVAVGYGFGTREEFEASGAEFIADTMADLRDLLLDGVPVPRGKFISFEGTDGCGKSTQMKKLGEYLTQRGYEVVSTREPGGCALSERIREVILSLDSKGMTGECEALLYAAARIEHVRKVILPALEAGKMVLCDRFLDSSYAYQAHGRELGEDFIRQINRAASEAVTPDRTLLFDIDRAAAKARLAQGAPLDRLEIEKEDFFQRVSQAYDALAQREPKRIRRIDSGRGIDEVFQDVLDALQTDIPTRG